MFRRFFAALMAALARIRGGISSAYSFMHDAVAEAAEPITDRLPWLRDRAEYAGRALAAAPDYAAIAAGKALAVPGAALGVLGSLLPGGVPTPKGVADQAVANDDAGIGGGGLLPQADLHAAFYRGAAEGLRDGGEAELRKSLPYIAPHVADWLRSLDRRDLEVACRLDPKVLARHATAESFGDCSLMLPPPLHLQPKKPLVSDEDLLTMKAQARRNLAGSAREAAALATRTPRLAAEPVWDDMPEYGTRPAFH